MNQERTTVKVIVRYPAAEKPYEAILERSTTVGELKKLVLDFFGLKEGSGSSGSIYTYTLYYEKRPLDNLSETLEQIAGDKETVEMKLSQQITQGQIG